MPSKKKLRSRKPTNELDRELILEFCIGWSLDHTHPDEARRQQVKELWKQHEKYIMGLWFDDSKEAEEMFVDTFEKRLFTRPDAWWRYSSPEPRKIFKTGYAAWPKRLEDEKAYLIRLNLLTEKESEILKNEQ